MNRPTASPSSPASPYRLLCVCTGNIARSPVLAALLQARTDSSVEVSSAGIRAVVGASVVPEMRELLGGVGVAADHLAARDITEEMIKGADLVLCLDAGHRRRVLELVPSAMRRTFLAMELMRLAGGIAADGGPEGAPDDAAALRHLVAAAAPRRGRLGPAGADEIADPYGHAAAAYRAAFTDIVAVVTVLERAVLLRRSRDRASGVPSLHTEEDLSAE